MLTKKELTDKIKIISKQISGDLKYEDGILPEYQIKGVGDSYFFSYIDRCFIKLSRGLEIYIICDFFDERGRTLAYTITHELILIEPEEIEYVGFN